MNPMRMALLVFMPALIVGLLANTGSCREAFGCSCVEPKPPATALLESKTVFSGKVLSIESNGNGKLVTFDVDRAWKGVTMDRLIASTPAYSAACGYEFEEGKEYLVYSNNDEDTLSVIICSRTQPLETAGPDLAVLGGGYVPAQSTDDGEDASGEGKIISLFDMPVIFGVGAAIAGIIAFFSIMRNRK